MNTLHSAKVNRSDVAITPLHSPSRNVATGRLGTVAAVSLALASFLPIEKAETKEKDQTFSVAERTTALAKNNHPEWEAWTDAGKNLEDLSINDGILTCTFDGQRITGTVNAQNELLTAQLRGYGIRLTHPVSQKQFERFLRNAVSATKHIDQTCNHITRDNQLEAYGGARFLFTGTTKDHGTHQYIATVRDVLRVIQGSDTTRLYRDDVTGNTITELNGTSPKNFERTVENGTALVQKQTYEDDYLRKHIDHENGRYRDETWYRHFSTGELHRISTVIHEHDNQPEQLLLRTDYWQSGGLRVTLDTKAGSMRYYQEDGDLVYGEDHQNDKNAHKRYMVDAKGNHFGNYHDEKAKNSDLTPSHYLDILAKKLDTPERFAVFFEQFFEYEYDNGDYWQSAEETVKRIDKESGKMEGDCDDWAFFGRDVKRRQGENAHVLLIPHHAICVWVREVQTKEGTRYHAYSIGTFGYDENGNRFTNHESDGDKVNGYDTVLDALNSLMKKYKYPGLGLSEGQDYELHENWIFIAPVPRAGRFAIVDSDFFLREV